MNNTPDSLAAHMALVDAYANDPTWRTKERAKEQRAAVEASARALIARADALERQAVPEGYTLDQIADACMAAEIPDSKFESISIALASSPPAPAQPEPQAAPCPNGEPWDPNPDGIKPGQESSGPHMDPHTGLWDVPGDGDQK